MPWPTNREELRSQYNAGEPFVFYLFYGHKPSGPAVDASCFSQWFRRIFKVDSIEYLTAEHWMMAEKARLFGDEAMLHAILNCKEPKEAKAFGRRVANFDGEVWDKHKYSIVVRGNLSKFQQNPDLLSFLLSTRTYRDINIDAKVAEAKPNYQIVSPERIELDPHRNPSNSTQSDSKQEPRVILVEAAGRDLIWGIGYGVANPKAQDPNQWRGRNLLGFALTEVRESLAADA